VNYAKEYFKYILKSKGRHGTHSPFIFKMVNECLSANIDKKFLKIRKKLFKKLKSDKKTINIEDFGAGSKFLKNKRKIKDIFNIGSSKGKYGLLLYKLNQHYKFNHILELGTSLGVGTFHLSKANTNSKIITIEGCHETFQIAKENLNKFDCKNVNLINQTFESFIKSYNHPVYDMVFIDGHHDGKALLAYIKMLKPFCHNDTFLILDDIRWSDSMLESWESIKNSNEFNVSIDFFRMGIILKRKQQEKEHFIIKLKNQ
jgi:predicted O-methyltransferase YrrM